METCYPMNNETRCPFCGEEIKLTAKKCKHCGEWLNYHCPVCGELISETSKICPECNTPIKKKKDYSALFKILSVLSIFACLFITFIFALVCMSCDSKEIADFSLKSGMMIFYCLFMFIPYSFPVISLSIGIENKFSSVAAALNTIAAAIFIFSLTFAGVIK